MADTVYALIAEFEQPDELVKAAGEAKAAGYRKIDAYSPFPVHGLADVLEIHDWRVPWLIFLIGAFGLVAGYSLEYFTSTPFLDHLPRWVRNLPAMNEMSYPLNVGGRPFHSWPTFVPVAYEVTILLASLTAFVGMLLLNGLPRPHHPIFNAPRFELASQDRFFLVIEAVDPKFEYEKTWEFLQGLGAASVAEVEN